VPEWVRWSPSDWDLTDFGSGDFEGCGLTMLTLRNGNMKDQKHAEKIMVVRESQITPIHFHWSKMEDIINRGGNIVLRIWNSTKEEGLSESDVVISIEGMG